MKKILLIICLFPILVFSQKSYKIPADSTILNNIGSGKNELVIRNATSNITGGVLTNLGNGVTAFVLGGGSARVVDTIYKNNTKDSIVFTISGIRYAVKDSFNLNTDSQTLSISNDTLTISGGNSVILPVYIQIDSATITSYDVLNSQNTPPVSPSTGDVYLVGTVPSGAWVGHAKDIAEWNGSAWVFTDGVQGDFLYNATTALTYIFRSGNWVQTTGVPALNNGNNISGGLKIGTNNARSLTFETNNVNRGRFDSIGRFHVYNIPTATDTFITTINSDGLFTKTGKTSIVDTNILSTKANVTGLLLTKQDNLVSGTNIKTINSNSLLGSGNIVTPDAQTLSAGTNTLTISGGNTVDLNRKVDSSYLSLNSTRDSLVFNNVINGINYRTAFRDSTGGEVTQQALNDSIARLDSTINAIPSPDLQSVTDIGNQTTNSIEINGTKTYLRVNKSDGSSLSITNDGGNGAYIRYTNLNTPTNGAVNIMQDYLTSVYSLQIPSPTLGTGDYFMPLSVNSNYADTTGSIIINAISDTTLSDSLYQIRTEIADTASSLHTLIDAKVSASGTATLTNKRITTRVDSTASSATPTINTDIVDTYKLTAQALDITSFTTNLSGTPTDDQILHIVIIGTATRAITWGSKFEASTVALPTTTVGTNRLDVYFIWNTNTSKWRCGGVW